MTGEMVEFLLACIAEDEAAAGAFRAENGHVRPWRADEVGGKVRQIGPSPFGLPDLVSESDTHLTAAHIARWDPARVLAECTAKRAIVVLHQTTTPGFKYASCPICYEEESGCGDSECCGSYPVMQDFPCQTLRLLAAPFSDRPGYRQEWTP